MGSALAHFEHMITQEIDKHHIKMIHKHQHKPSLNQEKQSL